MITLLTGNNTFEIDWALKQRLASVEGRVERYEAEGIALDQLADILIGQTLFDTQRTVVVLRPAENKELWDRLPIWFEQSGNSLELVLVQPSVDKRTASYKWLKKHADVQEFTAWNEWDVHQAEAWAISYAKRLGKALDKKVARVLVARTGVDQWRIHHALEKLTLLDEMTEADIENIVEQSPSENIFSLFETALSGNIENLHKKIETLSLTEDAYKAMGLLASQAFQLAVLASTDKPSAEVAKDLGAHPYVLGKLSPHAKRLGRSGARQVVQALATADMRLKSTDAEPWAVIEQALMAILTKH